jgi:hypothetical protein
MRQRQREAPHVILVSHPEPPSRNAAIRHQVRPGY